MIWGELLDILELQSRRAGLGADAVELSLLAYEQLQSLVDLYDLPGYTIIDDGLFVTSTGHASYPLPENFGRLIHPTKEGEYRIFLDDGSGGVPAEMTYVPPELYMTKDRTETGTPGSFTIANGQWWLYSVPDDNDGANYTGKGLYIAHVDRLDDDTEILLDTPHTLIRKTLVAAAGHRATPLMIQEAMRAEMVLAQNYAKQRENSDGRPWRSRSRYGWDV